MNECYIVNNWPEYKTYSESIRLLTNEILKYKGKWLTKVNIYIIFHERVYYFLQKYQYQSENQKKKLKDTVSVDHLIELTKLILEFYLSIPRKYQVYYPVDSFKRIKYKNLTISDNSYITLFKENSDLPKGVSPKGHGINLSLEPTTLELEKAYFVQNASGYILNSLNDSGFRDSLSSLKQAFYLLQVFDLTKLFDETNYLSNALLGYSEHTYSISKDAIAIDLDSDNQKICKIRLPISISQYLKNIVLNIENKFVQGIIGNGDIEGTAYILAATRLILGIFDKNPIEAQSIKSAMNWAFDTETEDNEKMAFIKASIGLEAILGDDKVKASLTETLADRCSYFLSKSIKDRKRYREKFLKFYDLRSKLVHGRLSHIYEEGIELLEWGKSTLKALIFKELELLSNDSNKG